jgi:hypothetical protein
MSGCWRPAEGERRSKPDSVVAHVQVHSPLAHESTSLNREAVICAEEQQKAAGHGRVRSSSARSLRRAAFSVRRGREGRWEDDAAAPGP